MKPHSPGPSQPAEETFDLDITHIRRTPGPQGAYELATLITNRGDVETHYYKAPNATQACVWLAGAIGGFHSPAHGLYMNLASEFVGRGISSLHIKYRDPHDLFEATLDTLAGLAFLEHEGHKAHCLTGHSFGGAVVIQAAALNDLVRTICPLSSQSYGADPAATLGPRCSMLLIHGDADEILPVSCSRHIYAIARQPKKLVIVPRTRHGLDEAAEQVHEELRQWIPTQLARPMK